MITVGGSEAIDIAMRAMLDPGDEVLIPQPSYVSYVPCVELTHAVPVIIELKEENEFRLTKEEVLEKIKENITPISFETWFKPLQIKKNRQRPKYSLHRDKCRQA